MISTYHEKSRDKRFALYVMGEFVRETADLNHAEYLQDLYKADGKSCITIKVFNANQVTPEVIG